MKKVRQKVKRKSRNDFRNFVIALLLILGLFVLLIIQTNVFSDKNKLTGEVISENGEISITDPKDLVGNYILISKFYWNGDYQNYAGAYCSKIQNCSGFKDVVVKDDSTKACRCDNIWGCDGKSCINSVSSHSSWERVGSVTCTGCNMVSNQSGLKSGIVPPEVLPNESEISITDPKDLVGNYILISKFYWNGDYQNYAGAYCSKIQNCSGFKDVVVKDDSTKACRCDNIWGCDGKSCIENVFLRSSWERVGSVTCTGCKKNYSAPNLTSNYSDQNSTLNDSISKNETISEIVNVSSTNKTTIISKVCIDSDGFNPNLRGHITTITKYGDSFSEDYCTNSTHLREIYCVNENDIMTMDKLYFCSAGCKEGACVVLDASVKNSSCNKDNLCTLYEGDKLLFTDFYKISYEIWLDDIFLNNTQTRLNVDSQFTRYLSLGETHRLPDGVYLAIRNMSKGIDGEKSVLTFATQWDASKITACKLEGIDYAFGERLNGDYCSIVGGTFVQQKIVDSECENNFECASNLCASEKCTDTTMIQKVGSFFTNIFK
jgi:hypothetical protein